MKTTIPILLISATMIIILDINYSNQLKIARTQSFNLGTTHGKALERLEIRTNIKKEITDSTCLAWWFNGDTKRVANEIKKIKDLN